MESQTITTAEGLIEYTDTGSGSPVLIVHGGNDNCFTNMRQDHLVCNGFRVLIPSRPGYGKTDVRHGKTASAQAQFLKMFLDSLGIPKVSVLTYSAGGAVALEFARLFPENTACLVLEDSMTKRWISRLGVQYYAMKFLFNPCRQAILWRKQREEYARDPGLHLKKLCRMFSLLPASVVLSEWNGKDIAYYEDALRTFDSGYGFIHTIDHVASHIETISVPTLIIHSPLDRNIPFSHALHAHKVIKNSQLFIAPSKSHLIYIGPDVDCILEKRLKFISSSISDSACRSREV